MDTTTDPDGSTPAKKAPTKSDIVMKLLSRPKGATVADMMSSTGWQPHTVRAFLTGVRKKANLVREARASGEAAYRIAGAPTANAAEA